MSGKILVTGFEPFGTQSINPSWEAVRRLPDSIGGCEVVKLLIPVVFDKAAELAWRTALEVGADTVLCIGQAGGRSAVTPEWVGINVRNGKDNSGVAYRDALIAADAPAAYFSTLPVREIAERLKAAGIPSGISYSAGTYVCNDLLYLLLHRAQLLRDESGETIRVGFVHLPFMPEQVTGGAFSMELDVMIKAVETVVSTAIGQ